MPPISQSCNASDFIVCGNIACESSIRKYIYRHTWSVCYKLCRYLSKIHEKNYTQLDNFPNGLFRWTKDELKINFLGLSLVLCLKWTAYMWFFCFKFFPLMTCIQINWKFKDEIRNRKQWEGCGKCLNTFLLFFTQANACFIIQKPELLKADWFHSCWCSVQDCVYMYSKHVFF